MIDNVRFSTKDLDTLVEVSLLFLSLCKKFKIQVNEENKFTENFIREQGQRDYIFLGEHYTDGNKEIKNSENNLCKLQKVLDKLNSDPLTFTYKNILAILSLILFLVHTLFSPRRFSLPMHNSSPF